MGGNTFSERLPAATFPRMPKPFYNSFKAQIIPRLEVLYHLVAVPPEAPGKLDYRDLDVLVCQPKNVKEGIPLSECVTLAEVERALGAAHGVPLPGDRTSNFAIPIRPDEVQHFAVDQKAVKEGKLDLEQLYVQVYLHFCKDAEIWRSRIIFQSYGELGMILGVLARAVGFTWSASALKLFHYDSYIPDPPGIRLSVSQPKIFEFFGLARDVHERGFSTPQEVFDWLVTSRFFDPHRLLHSAKALKFKGERRMYHEFLTYLESLVASAAQTKHMDVHAIQDEALSFFGKRKEFDDTVREKYLTREVKKVLSGSMVREWTGLSYWKDVKIVTDEMRVRVLNGADTTDGDWREEMIKLTVEERKTLALMLKEELIPPKTVTGKDATKAA